MSTADIWAVVPVKDASSAKQRLAEFIPTPLRAGLALAMFEDVLEALMSAATVAGAIIFTEDEAAAAIGHRYGARICTELARGGHTAVVRAAAQLLREEKRSSMLQVPGDIPLVTATEIDHLLEAHRAAPSFTIVPSRDFDGSNAVVVSPPDAVPLTFGDNSFYAHLRVARQCGIEPEIVPSAGIALDIDTPRDLWAFVEVPSRTRTRNYVEHHGLHLLAAAARAG